MADRDQLADAYREFTREMLARFERSMRAMIDELRRDRLEARAQFANLDRKTDDIVRKTDDIIRKTDEVIAENRAQREALFRILDRLGGGGAAPGTA